MSSNLLLTDKILSIRAKKPFLALAFDGACPSRLAELDDVRTFQNKKRISGKEKQRRLSEQYDVMVNDPGFMLLVDEIQDLFRQVGPEYPDLKKAA